VFFLSVYFSFMLTVDEILSILEDYNDMVDADIFMEPPENAEAREDKTFFLYMDNFFTSLPLSRRIKEKGHDAIGTISVSCIEKAPLKTIESMKKLARGTYNQLTDKNS